MFCSQCGKEIQEGVGFCPYCGAKQNSSNKSIDNMIDNAGEEIGSGIDDAVNEFKDSFKDTSEKISQKIEEADIKKNWKDYLTMENMEKLAAFALIIPLFMGIVNFVLTGVFAGFAFIPGIGFIFGLLLKIVRLLFVATAICGAVASGYVLYKNEAKRNTWSYILFGLDVAAALACILILFWPVASWWDVPAWVSPVRKILGLVALVFGVDAISRVVVQNKGMESEPNVSADIDAYKTWYENYKKNQAVEESKETAVAVAEGPESYFDGTGASLLGLLIIAMLVTCITCGLAAPWMICKVLKWRKSHTVINGRRLAFNGTGGSLFGHWILWEVLCVITCGIYSFFMYVALRRWEMQHTTYEDEPLVAGQFEGNSFEYLGYGILQAILLVVTCGLAAPWTITMIQKWQMKNTIVANDRMKYEGTALGLLGQYIIVALLSCITCGIYYSWGICRINKYIYSHTHVDR